MTKRWKSNKEISERFGVNNIDEIEPKAILNTPPAAIINQLKNYCKICGNAETSIRGIKNISKILKKEYTRLVYQILYQDKEKLWSVKQIINQLGAENLSGGELQRKALSALVATGYVKKHIIRKKIYNKRGEQTNEIEKHLFRYNDIRKIPECYDQINDVHKDNWILGEKIKKWENYDGAEF